MRRVLLHLDDGRVEVAEGPAPPCPAGGVLVGVTRSLVSAGTERMLAEFGRAGWLARVRAQPDRVRHVLDKVRTDGVAATVDAVRARLRVPLAPGYSCAGRVVEADAASGFAVGERVVTNGAHAEFVAAMPTMLARVPEGVDDDAAAFAVVGAVGLHGLRLLEVGLGERVVVVGLGLIGLLAAQIARAMGADVIGVEPDVARRALAAALGVAAVEPTGAVARVRAWSGGAGADAVLVTAASASRTLLGEAADMCRARGRIVLTGVAPVRFARDALYAKEIRFQVSAAYGAGRSDPAHEAGADLPLAHVRWTMARNFAAVLEQIAAGRVLTAPLVSHRFALGRAGEAYDTLRSGGLGILLEHGDGSVVPTRRVRLAVAASASRGPGIAVIGAGEHAARAIVPGLKRAGARLSVLVDRGGAHGPGLARAGGFAVHASEVGAALADRGTGGVVIATGHASHAALAVRALEAGCHVLVEKPPVLTLAEADALEAAWLASGRVLMAGFNRRWSPHVAAVSAGLARVGAPPVVLATVNAGALAVGHAAWGEGGRLVGEACHFVDLARALAGSAIVSVGVAPLVDRSRPEMGDSAVVALGFAGGASASIAYLANGHPRVPKERIEVFAGGAVWTIDNFRATRAEGDAGFRTVRSGRPDKGHDALMVAFAGVVAGGAAPVHGAEVLEVARASVRVATLAAAGGGWWRAGDAEV